MAEIQRPVAWLDHDGKHVWTAHDCKGEWTVVMLPWPNWQALGSADDRLIWMHPSFDCHACGLHEVLPIVATLPHPASASWRSGWSDRTRVSPPGARSPVMTAPTPAAGTGDGTEVIEAVSLAEVLARTLGEFYCNPEWSRERLVGDLDDEAQFRSAQGRWEEREYERQAQIEAMEWVLSQPHVAAAIRAALDQGTP